MKDTLRGKINARLDEENRRAHRRLVAHAQGTPLKDDLTVGGSDDDPVTIDGATYYYGARMALEELAAHDREMTSAALLDEAEELIRKVVERLPAQPASSSGEKPADVLWRIRREMQTLRNLEPSAPGEQL